MTRFYTYINEQKTLNWKDYTTGNDELKKALEVMKIIEDAGYEALIVGGFVRDVILGIPSKDIDIATNMPPKEIDRHFNQIDIGKNKQFGVNVVVYKGFQYELAQYRADIYNSLESGKGAENVELVSSFKDDAARRDFTINSLGINFKGEIIDHHGGTGDLETKKIAAVGDPKLRFTEDAVRMMRGIRGASKLGFEIEPKTKETIKQMASDITKVSPERIREELMKMASQSGDKFADAIVLLDDVGILEIILPEITKLKEFQETPEHHPEAYEYGEGRVYDHVLAAVRKNKLKDPIVNFAILLHDIGKNERTYQKIEGKHTFRNHAEKSKDLIDNIAERLKLSKRDKDALLFSVLNHMKIMHATEMKPTKIMKLVNDRNWAVLKAVFYADDASRIGLFDKKEHNKIINHMEQIAKKWGEKVANTTAKVIDGKRVMDITGLRSGPKVGEIIKKVTDMVINQGSKEPIDKLINRAYNEVI